MANVIDQNGNRSFDSVGIAVGELFSFSLDLRVTSGPIPQSIYAAVSIFDGAGVYAGDVTSATYTSNPTLGEWYRLKVEGRTRSASDTFFNVGWSSIGAFNGTTFETRRPMLNLGPEALPFTPVAGSTAEGDFVVKTNPSGSSATFIRVDDTDGSYTFVSGSDLNTSGGNAKVVAGEFIEGGTSLTDKYAAIDHAHLGSISWDFDTSVNSPLGNGQFEIVDTGSTVGASGNPVYTAAIVAAYANHRQIALSVDQDGYLWGLRGHSTAGNTGWLSQVKQADALSTARTISLTGDVTGSASFDGSANISISATVADDSHDHNSLTGNLTVGGMKFYENDGYGNMGIRFNSQNDGSLAYEDGIAWELDVANDSLTGDFSISYADNIAAAGDLITSMTLAFRINGSDGKVNAVKGLQENGTDLSALYLGISSTAAAATKLATARTISLTGDVTGSASFDGSAAVSIAATVGDLSAIYLPVAGTAAKATKLATARTISLTGDATGSASFDGSGNISIATTVASSGASWGNITGTLSNQTDLQSALNGKLSTSGTAADSSKLGGLSHTSANTASTIMSRNGSGDTYARLFRSTYADQSTVGGGIAFRNNASSDNYIRFCSSPSAVRSWLGAGTGTANTASKSNSGWWKCGDTGIIIQWAYQSSWNSVNNTYSANWPITFPTACRSIQFTYIRTSSFTTQYAPFATVVPGTGTKMTYYYRVQNSTGNGGVMIFGIGY